jgi:molecular chaperone GrpE
MTDKKKPGSESSSGQQPDPDAVPGADEAAAQTSEDGDTADVHSVDDLVQAEDADVETLTDEELSFLEAGERDLLAEMRNDLARAQAELVNFRNRVERDRAANRAAVIAEVIRTLLPAVDDLYRAESHGDLAGSPLEIVAQKLHAAFTRYGLRAVGQKGEAFDPNLHEAVVQLPSADVTVNTVADVIEPGYALGERLLRAAKVAVFVPDGE